MAAEIRARSIESTAQRKTRAHFVPVDSQRPTCLARNLLLNLRRSRIYRSLPDFNRLARPYDTRPPVTLAHSSSNSERKLESSGRKPPILKARSLTVRVPEIETQTDAQPRGTDGQQRATNRQQASASLFHHEGFPVA